MREAVPGKLTFHQTQLRNNDANRIFIQKTRQKQMIKPVTDFINSYYK